MTREFDGEVNVFGCRRCGNKDPDKIEPVIEFIGTTPSGLIGHARLAKYAMNGLRCLVCDPKTKT